MRLHILLLWIFIVTASPAFTQRECSSADYLQNELVKNPSLHSQLNQIESFIQQRLANTVSTNGGGGDQQVIIKIPVVVHILYHLPGENISDQQVYTQLDMLNKCFRRTNADTINTPAVFKSRAADCEIEFHLAISDPQKRRTNGIIRKYTPIPYWQADDQMKLSSQMGDDAWDYQNYLNIWVCNMRKVAGYSSVPGGEAAKDGVVIDYTVFGTNTSTGYEMGKTAVHEVGHWLGLKHIWGDDYCGDDHVDDTPKQKAYNVGCPSAIRISCDNGPAGDMFMNYMDYTNDGCINIFTQGQKARMRSLFVSGGFRHSMVSSYGLNQPLYNEAPLPEEPPRWLHAQLYPNPANTEIILDVAYDARWIGKTVSIFNVNGQLVMQALITARIHTINISKLKPGLYFISTKKEDGSFIKQKFIKI